MSPLSFGLFAVSAMLICYALESAALVHPGFCLLLRIGSVYGFLQGAWPSAVEGVWTIMRRGAGGVAGKERLDAELELVSSIHSADASPEAF